MAVPQDFIKSLSLGGGHSSPAHFEVTFFGSKHKIWGLEGRRRTKQVSTRSLDPSAPNWGAHPTEKYLYPKAHPLEKN